VDKARLQAKSYHDKNGKESVNFAFPFNVPNGEMLVDVPLGAFRPEKEQMPSACKNWLTVGRWVEVANRERGITWVTLDAPLIEVGHLSANLLNSQTNPDVWRKKIDKTQKFYSWVMNNHWGTNYRAYQDGLTRFRYILRPHDNSADPAEATRFATQFSSPLWVRPGGKELAEPLLRLSNEDVVVIGLKPSDDGKALILRLFGASGKDASTKLEWGAQKPKATFLSDTSEKPGRKVSGRVSVPGYGLVTLRAELE
jgi:alpha-mannosidase